MWKSSPPSRTSFNPTSPDPLLMFLLYILTNIKIFDTVTHTLGSLFQNPDRGLIGLR